jgi:hypothetical protein
MSLAENSRTPAINYQNSVTPPWLTNIWLICLAIAVFAVALSAYKGGFASAAISFVLFILGSLISGITSSVLGSPPYRVYYRVAFRTLINREADYRRRDGDLMRAEAAKHFYWLMVTLLGEDNLR